MLERVTADGLLNRRNQPLSSQAIGALVSDQLYAGIIDVPDYGVRNKRGDFEPIITEDLFRCAQAVLSGRLPSTAPRLQAHPDFPLRNFVRCATCNRGLTGRRSKGRSDYYAYCHCRPGCRGVNVTKAKLESMFIEELARLQPGAVYLRSLKEEVLQIWKTRKASIAADLADAERREKAIQAKLDRLDEAFLFEQSIDIDVYDRHAEKLREELTRLRMDGCLRGRGTRRGRRPKPSCLMAGRSAVDRAHVREMVDLPARVGTRSPAGCGDSKDFGLPPETISAP